MSMLRANASQVMLVLLIVLPIIVTAQLSLSNKKCGTSICKIHQFCPSYHNRCEDCQNVCDSTSHNQDEPLCLKECQDYLHDIRFSKSSHYEEDMQIVQQKLNIVIAISILMLILWIIYHGMRTIRWCKRNGYVSLNWFKKFRNKNQEKPTPALAYMHENPHTKSPKLGIRNNNVTPSEVFSVTGAESTMHTVSTPVSHRHPAEDSTENYSYDNGGLAITPIHEKPRGGETTF